MGAGGFHGRGHIGRPNKFTWEGSTGTTHDGRGNAKWVLKDLGADIDSQYLRHTPNTQDLFDVELNGVMMLWGDADNPRDVRFVAGNFDKPYFYFESTRTVGNSDLVSIIP